MHRVSKLTLGTPEEFTHMTFHTPPYAADAPLPAVASRVEFEITARGCTVRIPMDAEEEVFGFGLQLKSVAHRGTRKRIRVNADPLSDCGDTHAPVPFYITNKGYGLFVDNLRNVTFYCGRAMNPVITEQKERIIATSEAEIYKAIKNKNDYMVIDIPVAKGVDLYFFEGDSVGEITAEYNRFSGGGCLPPLWGLGILYRCHARHSQDKVLDLARRFRSRNIPCDIIGLEPGWQSHAYSSSYVWNNDLFPDPDAMIAALKEMGYHLNLWEQAFIAHASPVHSAMKPYGGNYTVWEGIVPDLTFAEARKILADHHREAFAHKGVDGFKLDECDCSDFTGGWSFPDCTLFPSGMDGEQMHAVFGKLFQMTLLEALEGRETFSEVRNTGAFAAPLPFALYSDLYGYHDFLRGSVNAGHTGLLWAAELREAADKEELLRRVQMAVFSAQTVINCWYLENPPWEHLDAEKEVKALFDTRMSLAPYLHSAFYRYHTEGKAPVRALVSDYSQDKNTYALDSQYLFGDHMIICPMAPGEKERQVYLPEGDWYDFWTGEKFAAGTHTVATSNIPVFVRGGSLIPVAKPQNHFSTDEKTEITLRFYGNSGAFELYDDVAKQVFTLNADTEPQTLGRYIITGKQFIC